MFEKLWAGFVGQGPHPLQRLSHSAETPEPNPLGRSQCGPPQDLLYRGSGEGGTSLGAPGAVPFVHVQRLAPGSDSSVETGVQLACRRGQVPFTSMPMCYEVTEGSSVLQLTARDPWICFNRSLTRPPLSASKPALLPSHSITPVRPALSPWPS